MLKYFPRLFADANALFIRLLRPFDSLKMARRYTVARSTGVYSVRIIYILNDLYLKTNVLIRPARFANQRFRRNLDRCIKRYKKFA